MVGRAEIRIRVLVTAAFVILAAAGRTGALDAPHNQYGDGTVGVICSDCHYSVHEIPPGWVDTPDGALGIDDTFWNRMCKSCHGSGMLSSLTATHSSNATSEEYGLWSLECRTCHNPHSQRQLKSYGAEAFLLPAAAYFLDAIEADTPYAGLTTITLNAALSDEYQGYLLLPNIRYQAYMNKIVSTTSGAAEIVVGGDITSRATVGSEVNIFLGRLVREAINTPHSGTLPVRFFQRDSDNSFADDTGAREGVCEVCHTQTRNRQTDAPRHRNDANADSHYVGQDCTECHTHERGLAHSGGDVPCVACHGHDEGSAYDDDMAYPNGGSGGTSEGRGSFVSHSTHTETDGDDLRGPGIYCNTCHDIGNLPFFKSGSDANGDGRYSLEETDVCDACHSPGGSYDGVADAVIGAKTNWSAAGSSTSQIYAVDGSFQPGKDKWCAGCHDESPSQIQSVDAPNVIGDEDGSYTYGTGWGYYRTGHGLSGGETYPSKGGIQTLSGRPVQCDSCHDSSTAHVDGLARTFDCGPAGDRLNCDAAEYRTSYRLKLVDGEEPMVVPWRGSAYAHDPRQFRLCAQCHLTGPFTVADDTNTNFYTWSDSSGDNVWVNRHYSHIGLGGTNSTYPADYAYDDGANSRITCVVCHNVHGSTRLAMIRDGKLINREPGMEIWYADEDTEPSGYAGPWPVPPPIPDDVTLADSLGTFWAGGTTANLCNTCHVNTKFKYRCEPVDILGDDPDLGVEPDCSSYVPPFQTVAVQPPTLEWTGENGYVGDGVDPDNGPAGNFFTFRVMFSDAYGYAPSTIQLWIDKDDDGSYENVDGDSADEKIDLVALDPYDTDTSDGNIYTADVLLGKAGDNGLTYRFYAVSPLEVSVQLPAAPGPDLMVSVTNNRPVLSWTEDTYFETDGVHPNTGGLGGDYEFRITYTDVDNECPASGGSRIQVWIDEDDDGYEAGEKYNLTEVSAGDTDCTDGKIYAVTRTLSSVGAHDYRFHGSDGIDDATGEAGPIGDSTVTVQATVNSPPQLDWVAEPCLTGGVRPALGLATGDFEFKVRYTDPDGDAPSSIKVWVDLNDDDVLDAGEEQDLAWVDDGDEDYTDGEVFAYSWTIGEVDAGVHEFVFSASGGGKDAVGEPAVMDSNRTVTVKSATEGTDKFKGVRQGPGETGPVWYGSIQAAVDASGSLDYTTTILVYEGIFNENVALDRLSAIDNHRITLQSVCGPELTVIQGRDDDDNGEPDGIAVYFNEISTPVIDGFTITGGTEGILIFHAYATIKNCIIEGNGRGIRSNNDIGLLTMEDTTIQNNVGTGGGAGVYLYGGSAQHTIAGSVIQNNQTADFGGGIYLINSGSGKGLAIEDTTISGNTASGSGGGIYITRSLLDLEKVTLSSNTAGAGGGLFIKENSNVTMTNTNVAGNTADSAGGGISMWCPNAPGSVNMTNCTVSNNSISDPDTGSGGGLNTSGAYAATISIKNSIFWANKAGSGHDVSNNTPGTISFTWSDVLNDSHALSGGGTITTDATCIGADPFFMDRTVGDYHLKSISPVIDQGTATGAPVEDIDGDARDDGSPDMGSDEHVP